MSTWQQHPTALVLLILFGLLIACLLIVTAVILLVRARQKDQAEEGEQAPDTAEPKVFSSQWQILTDSFHRAMRRLSDKSPGRDYQYAVPWYVLLGESGSGKSAIADSLSGAQSEWVESPGGTNEPRWLLLGHAVLIDLPGQILLSKECVEPESRWGLPAFLRSRKQDTAWQKFLQLTTRYRPRQPLNGIVLAVSAEELLDAVNAPDHAARMARLAHLGKRLNEIQGLTGLSLPVYVLVTSCETLNGFSSYTQALVEYGATRANRRDGGGGETWDDIFGWSNPYSLERAYDSGWVQEAFASTSEVLLHRQLEILATCNNRQQAEGVLLFPFGIQQLCEPIQVLLDLVFASTAYQNSHALRGIYFCGRRSDEDAAPLALVQEGNPLARRTSDFVRSGLSPMAFVRNLFESKVFAEQFLATSVGRRIFRGNRSVLTAQFAGALLILILAIGFMRSWGRISDLQSSTLNPILLSVGQSLQKLPSGSAANVRPAVDLLNSAALVENVGYTSLAMPYSYLDTLHSDLDKAVETIIGRVLIDSCKRALENRVAALTNPPLIQPSVKLPTYPPGNAWTVDPSYTAVERYLDDVTQLNTNVDHYTSISSAGFGTFTELNALLRYLGGRGLPDASRFARDRHYTQLLQNATWDPISMPPTYDATTAENTSKLIQGFYLSWFDSNPLKNEVDQLAGPDGLQSLAVAQSHPTNAQLRSLVSDALEIQNQLNDGSYDWLAGTFSRASYPALGSHLDHMAFATSQFKNAVEINGEKELASLQIHLQQSGVLTTTDGRVRLDGKIQTLASVLNALLQYDLMNSEQEKDSSCSLLPRTTIWSQADLSKAIQIETTREKIEGDLLPSLPENYRLQVKAVVDDRASNAIYAALKSASASDGIGTATERGLESALRNFDQSVDSLNQIDRTLYNLHASADVSCLNNAMVSQAKALLARVNQQTTGLYIHPISADDGSSGLPNSEWVFGVSSQDELQAFLASERQNVIALSTEASPLVDLLRSKGSRSSDVLAKWQRISRDVDALQAKKPGGPIQLLEAFITNDLDKITPQASCKTPAMSGSNDEFLSIRADLSRVAVDRCQRMAVGRFNQLASIFNAHLAGRFPFSRVLDTRAGAEADLTDIAGFYDAFDQRSDGLSDSLITASANPTQYSSFLRSLAEARPLVTAVGKAVSPAVMIRVQFRTNRSREVLGNRIAEWTLTVGQKTISSLSASEDTPPLQWQYGDPVMLSLRYAFDSPETPSSMNPSEFARVQDRTITYRYTDPWALLSFLEDHQSDLPGVPNEYVFHIPNQFASGRGEATPQQTTVYMRTVILPAGAKEGTAPLTIPVFPARAPVANFKMGHGA